MLIEVKEWYIAEARKRATDELEIDDRPRLSKGEDGVWVQAWIWIANPVKDDDEE